MLLGGITLGGKLGGFEFSNHSAKNLPQALASAVTDLFYGEKTKLGASYVPLWYLGSQLVNGRNYSLICEQTRSTKDFEKRIVAVIINIPAGNIDGSNASIVEVIDDADLIEGSNANENVKKYFDDAIGGLIGVEYTPVLYVGQQLVKGVNYFVIAQAKVIYPDSEPYAVMIKFNVFQGNSTLVEIEKLS